MTKNTNTKNGMQYEDMPSKPISNKAYKKLIKKNMSRLATSEILFYIILRHRVFLLVTINVLLVAQVTGMIEVIRRFV